MKRSIIFSILLLSSSTAFSAENSMQNMFNNNVGSIGTVNISQSNSMTNEQLASDKKINELYQKANSISTNPNSTQEQKKEASQLSTVAGIANDINQRPGTTVEQRNQMCTSKVQVAAQFLGYEVGFMLNKCTELF